MIKILLLGDVIIDEYVYGSVNRISPEASVPILNIYSKKKMVGGVNNVGKILDLASVDYEMVYIKNQSDSLKLNFCKKRHPISLGNYRWPVKTRYVSNFKNSHLLRVDDETEIKVSKDDQNLILKEIIKKINESDLIAISDYNKGLISSCMLQEIIEYCNVNQKKVIIDTKKSSSINLNGVYLYKPNKYEFNIVSDRIHYENETIDNSALRFKNKVGLKNILITDGDKGCTLYGENNIIMRANTRATEVREVSGAGDSVFASIIISIAHNFNQQEMLDMAMDVAAATIKYSPFEEREIYDEYIRIFQNKKII